MVSCRTPGGEFSLQNLLCFQIIHIKNYIRCKFEESKILILHFIVITSDNKIFNPIFTILNIIWNPPGSPLQITYFSSVAFNSKNLKIMNYRSKIIGY
jgi:hypothetical protein